MEDCDEYAGQLQRLRGEQQARVDLHPVDDGEVAAGQQLEPEEEGGERVGDHQRQHEGYVRRLVLRRRMGDPKIIQREQSRSSLEQVVKKSNKSQRAETDINKSR